MDGGGDHSEVLPDSGPSETLIFPTASPRVPAYLPHSLKSLPFGKQVWYCLGTISLPQHCMATVI